ncbi:MAG: 4a-hydroxytetrahydrobiopterin dehydratase [Methylacidiphilales bacterium]|nr:4a-hydroxytetrahydrobiopterin dehydratase [Candidatus Methylacidiphilales bacterium]MDW8349826.1 4a-hydroxytetrahydrobiopterin dehydratase [Verrucomicrobiae bacterium]
MKPSIPTPWQETSDGLKGTFVFKDFQSAMAFVNAVAQVAENENHHPDIDIRWNKVHLTLITHDAGHRITEKDYRLAALISELKK